MEVEYLQVARFQSRTLLTFKVVLQVCCIASFVSLCVVFGAAISWNMTPPEFWACVANGVQLVRPTRPESAFISIVDRFCGCFRMLFVSVFVFIRCVYFHSTRFTAVRPRRCREDA